MKVELETILSWGEAKRVETKVGPRLLRKAAPTDALSIVTHGRMYDD